jgi:hypothetical protein
VPISPAFTRAIPDYPQPNRLQSPARDLPGSITCRGQKGHRGGTAGVSGMGAYAVGRTCAHSRGCTGAWPGIQTFGGWKNSGVTGRNGFGPHYLPQFMREQSHTLMEV